MKFIHCPYCGEKLDKKSIGDEGLVPYCNNCEVPIFDLMYTCILTLVINEFNEIALIRQEYVSKTNYVCVAGHIKSGEDAENTVIREVKEELGLDVVNARYIKSYYYEKKDMLMLGFVSKVKKDNFNISSEVDEAQWFSIDEALVNLKDASIAIKLLKDYLKEYNKE